MSNEKVFPEGLFIKDVEVNPTFSKKLMTIKPAEFYSWCKEHEKNGVVFLDLLTSRSGKPYFCFNKWEPSVTETIGRSVIPTPPAVEIDVDDIPF
tara:strand:+ start:546 stop:830 length:285 start_codon:yes stop_codon:yes gene_type:complete